MNASYTHTDARDARRTDWATTRCALQKRGAGASRGSRPAIGLRSLLFGPLLSLGCAAAGLPTQSRFPSIRDQVDAFACATTVLRREGFVANGSAPDALSAVMLQRREPSPDRPDEWWRVEVSVTEDDDGRTMVAAVAGAARRPDGPYEAPPGDLQHVLGLMSARCTW